MRRIPAALPLSAALRLLSKSTIVVNPDKCLSPWRFYFIGRIHDVVLINAVALPSSNHRQCNLVFYNRWIVSMRPRHPGYSEAHSLIERDRILVDACHH